MGGFGTQSSSQQSTPTNLTAPEFTALAGPLADAIRGLFATGGPTFGGALPAGWGAAPAPETLAAPVTPTQTALLGQLTSAGPGPNYAASQELLGRDISGANLSTGNPFINAMVQAAQGDLQRQFEGSIVPQLLSRFTGSGQEVQGQGSSAFAHEAGLAANDQAKRLADISTNLRGNAYEAERARQEAAVGQAGALSQAETQRLVTTLQQAALPQLVQDLGIQRGLAEFQRRMQTLLAALGIGVQAAQPSIGQTSSGSSSGFNLSLFGG
jgi:hypothetical protein